MRRAGLSRWGQAKGVGPDSEGSKESVAVHVESVFNLGSGIH